MPVKRSIYMNPNDMHQTTPTPKWQSEMVLKRPYNEPVLHWVQNNIQKAKVKATVYSVSLKSSYLYVASFSS